jgi:hypothetical protein
MLPPLPEVVVGEELSYAAFVGRLAHPLSSEVVQALQRFVSAFVRRQRQRGRQQQSQQAQLLEGDGEMAEGLHAFIDGLRGEMRKSPAWAALLGAAAGAADPAQQQQQQQWEEVREHLEAFLVTKLHRYLFTPPERKVLAARDAALQERFRGLAFLGPEHLDVRSVRVFGMELVGLCVWLLKLKLTLRHAKHPHPQPSQLLGSASTQQAQHQPPPPPISKALAPAIAALGRVVQQKSPRAAMDCLLAASRHITRALVATRRDGTLPGADEVLPALILVIKESNPPGLHTALETVQLYRHPRKLHVSEAAYVFTNVVSAVHFLETVIKPFVL